MNQVFLNHVPHVVFAQRLDFLHFVRGSEAIEEVNERYARFERRRVSNHSHIHALLNGSGGDQSPSGATTSHHVRMVAEDRKRVGGHGASRDVKYRRGKLARDLEHIWDHQQQTLRSGKCRGQCTDLQRAMHRPGSTAFGL